LRAVYQNEVGRQFKPTAAARFTDGRFYLLDGHFPLRYALRCMSNVADPRHATDYVGCAGALFLLVILAALLVSLLAGRDTVSSLAPPPASTTAPLPTLAQPLPSRTSPALALVTNTATPTHTPSSTVTHTPTITPSPTNTLPPTNTPLPAVIFPTPTYTPMPAPQLTDNISFTIKVPILMYHYVSTPPDFEDELRVRLSTEPVAFREQMRYLAENGYTTIDLYDLHLAITNQVELPEKPVILTFDDGHRDHYTNVFPVLQEFGLKGTFFIITEFVDQGYETYLTWEMIREMALAGHRMEPHTKTHPDLRGQSRDYLIYQILGSQQTLEYHIGYLPRYFAYPGGGFDDRAIAVLQELGFWGAVSTLGGKWHSYDDRYIWERLRIRYNMPLPEFVDLVNPVDAIYGKPLNLAPTATSTPLPPTLNQP
jgi:peptidoglycan/xylan/chitin deacetylase (PgdA/CDA1 family)